LIADCVFGGILHDLVRCNCARNVGIFGIEGYGWLMEMEARVVGIRSEGIGRIGSENGWTRKAPILLPHGIL